MLLVSYYRCNSYNKSLQIQWLKPTQICYLMVLKIRHSKWFLLDYNENVSRLHLSSDFYTRICFLAFPWLLEIAYQMKGTFLPGVDQLTFYSLLFFISSLNFFWYSWFFHSTNSHCLITSGVWKWLWSRAETYPSSKTWSVYVCVFGKGDRMSLELEYIMPPQNSCWDLFLQQGRKWRSLYVIY